MMIMFPFFLAIIVGIVIFIIWSARGVIQTQGLEQERTKSALDLLKERYAKGEISKNEYENIKNELGLNH